MEEVERLREEAAGAVEANADANVGAKMGANVGANVGANAEANADAKADAKADAAAKAKATAVEEEREAHLAELRRRVAMADVEEGGSARPYETLGLSPDCSQAEVRRAYKRLALRFHPDKNGGGGGGELSGAGELSELAAAAFQEVVAAFEVLGTPDKRLAFDELAGLGGSWSAAPSSSSSSSSFSSSSSSSSPPSSSPFVSDFEARWESAELSWDSDLYRGARHVTTLTERVWERRLHGDAVWLVKCYAAWCPACKAHVGQFHSTAEKLKDEVEVEVGAHPTPSPSFAPSAPSPPPPPLPLPKDEVEVEVGGCDGMHAHPLPPFLPQPLHPPCALPSFSEDTALALALALSLSLSLPRSLPPSLSPCRLCMLWRRVGAGGRHQLRAARQPADLHRSPRCRLLPYPAAAQPQARHPRTLAVGRREVPRACGRLGPSHRPRVARALPHA